LIVLSKTHAADPTGSAHASLVALSQTVDVFFKVRPGDPRGNGDGLTLHSRCEYLLTDHRCGGLPAGNLCIPLLAIAGPSALPSRGSRAEQPAFSLKGYGAAAFASLRE